MDVVSYTPIQDHQYDRDMDMDDDDRSPYVQPDRYTRDTRDSRDSRELDPRDPRAPINSRPMPPVTSSYMGEPGHPAYAIASAQTGPPPMGFEPRTFAPAGGNKTPPTGFRPANYPPSDIPPRIAQQPNPPMPPQSYLDPRTGKMVSSYQTYPTDTRARR